MKPWLGWLPCAGLLAVSSVSSIQAAMLWSNTYPEQAVRYAAVLGSVNAPIHFFGLCVDQDGKPLADVSIKMGVRYWKGISPIDLRGEGRKFERTSDGSGRFELTGTTGDVAGIDDASKDGYLWIRSGTISRNFYRPREPLPSLDQPVVLQFWKLRGAEPLHVAQPLNFQGIRCNGEPVTYDLITGAKTPSGANPTVRFAMQRTPESLPRQSNAKYDWQYTIEVPGGEIQETATNMPFLAPGEGYLARASIGFKADDPTWKAEAQRVLFFKTGAGTFGRLEVRLLADDEGNEASFKWTAYINPSGSPVLEYDPAKRLKPPARSPTSDLQAPAPASVPPGTVPSAAPPPAANRSAPFLAQPPPGFQALTNRATPFAPLILPRP